MTPSKWDRLKNHFSGRLKQSEEARLAARERGRARAKAAPKQPARFDAETIRPAHYVPTGGTDGTTLNTWRIWVETGTSTTTVNTASTLYDPWNQWFRIDDCTSSTIYGATLLEDPWHQWTRHPSITLNDATSQATVNATQWIQWQSQPRSSGRITVEETEATKKWRAEQAERQRLTEERYKAVEAKRLKAEETAKQLLRSMLNFQQKMDFDKNGYFYVDAPSGRLYRIDYGTHGNVRVVDRTTKKLLERLCIQPRDVPAGDANLMQKLLIETSEDAFRRHANITDAQGQSIYSAWNQGVGDLTGQKLAEIIPLRKTG